jgi:hypothetical protein
MAGLVVVALGIGASACGGEKCRDLEGTWTITQHCEEAFIGLDAVISQDGCDIAFEEPWPEFAGQVNEDGTMTFGGVIDATEVINCHGSVTDTRATLMCDDCPVVLSR